MGWIRTSGPPGTRQLQSGHQADRDLVLAPQLSLEISNAIDSGAFFENRVLRAARRTWRKARRRLECDVHAFGYGWPRWAGTQRMDSPRSVPGIVFERIGLSMNQVRIQAFWTAGTRRRGHLSNGETGWAGSRQAGGPLAKTLLPGGLAWVVGRSLGWTATTGKSTRGPTTYS